MNAEEYGQLKQTIIDLVPRNCIAVNLPKKLIIRAPNGTFIKFGHMEMSPELLDGMPQMTVDMLHNKLIIQWTDDVEKDVYENIGMEIMGKAKWKDPRAKEAMIWMGTLMNVKQFFEGGR